ncbi:hypothetical protein LINPERPRIM_LOCUS31535 [Linum perenne]
MHLSGEEVDKMSVWKKSRSMTNPDVIEAVEMYEDLLSKEPEDQRKLIAVRDRIFHIVMGDDGHGYCRTYGSSVPRHLVYPKPSTLSETTNDLLKKLIEEVTRFGERLETLEVRVNSIENRDRNLNGQNMEGSSGYEVDRRSSVGDDAHSSPSQEDMENDIE